MSPDELEALLGEVERQGTTMSSLLTNAAVDAETRLWNLRDFLIARRGGLARTTFVENEWHRITPLLAAEFFGNREQDVSPN